MPSPPPKWWKDGTCYQIWPASYKDSNGDGLGDIPGVISTLDYVRDLGIDIIWLSPTYASPQADMGYDISDYEAIYPPFGTMADMETLIAEVHARGMRIILDLVINHTSDRHAWFHESRKSKDNKYSDYYMWQPPKYDAEGKRGPPNNWRAAFGGSTWEYVPERDEYYLHLFTKEQPDLNWEDPEVRRAIYATAIESWLERGVDGFRVDTVNLYSKDTAFPDARVLDPSQDLQFPIDHVLNGPRIHEFLKEIRRDVLSRYGGDDGVMMVGECGMAPREEILRYVSAREGELSMVFDFAMMRVGLEDSFDQLDWKRHTLPQLKVAVEKAQLLADDDAWTTVFAENHDSSRSLNRFATASPPASRIKAGRMLAIFLGALTGTLFLYQGQEIGMTNIPESWPISDYRDVATLNAWKEVHERRFKGSDDDREAILAKAWKALQASARDNCRTPVQWDDSAPNAGFCPAGVKPWIRVNDNYADGVNVQAALADPYGILHMWRRVLQLRKHPRLRDVLVYGDFEIHNMEHPHLFVYTKAIEEKKVLVLCNFSDDEQESDLPQSWRGREKEMELLVANVEEAQMREKLGPWEARAYLLT